MIHSLYMTLREEIAWAAGFIDGEGCISFEVRKEGASTTYRLRVAASNTRKAPLRKLKRLFGGTIAVVHTGSKTHKPAWKWHVDCLTAERTLQALSGLLVVKHKQAALGLRSRAFICVPGRRRILAHTHRQLARIKRTFTQLNHKGP